MENIWSKLSNDLAEVSAAAGKSVVAVQGTRHPSSGIVIAKDAVVAASHAVRRDDEITVITAPGQKLSARVAGRDPSTDLVVLRLQQPLDAPPVRWASTSKLARGRTRACSGADAARPHRRQFRNSLRLDQRPHAHVARR